MGGNEHDGLPRYTLAQVLRLLPLEHHVDEALGQPLVSEVDAKLQTNVTGQSHVKKAKACETANKDTRLLEGVVLEYFEAINV